VGDLLLPNTLAVLLDPRTSVLARANGEFADRADEEEAEDAEEAKKGDFLEGEDGLKGVGEGEGEVEVDRDGVVDKEGVVAALLDAKRFWPFTATEAKGELEDA